jgi:hypothetical protein
VIRFGMWSLFRSKTMEEHIDDSRNELEARKAELEMDIRGLEREKEKKRKLMERLMKEGRHSEAESEAMGIRQLQISIQTAREHVKQLEVFRRHMQSAKGDIAVGRSFADVTRVLTAASRTMPVERVAATAERFDRASEDMQCSSLAVEQASSSAAHDTVDCRVQTVEEIMAESEDRRRLAMAETLPSVPSQTGAARTPNMALVKMFQESERGRGGRSFF